ncbi:phosphoribosyltransferase [Marinobacter sp. M1N3S26]|uniref:phosphoribosyltransferase n=1 Tax=unclassified Marinobacter TaxID=83889 RepID=UPI00387AD672
MDLPIPNRTEAGRELAAALAAGPGGPPPLVLALPRGGVPVAAPIAERLEAPLDLMVVRKLGFPGHEEFAMGAIASGGVRIMNDAMLHRQPVSQQVIDRVARSELAELERRERTYRGDRPAPDLVGRPVILVDDGLATGATMRAAIRACREQGATSVCVAVPVGPPDTVAQLRGEADEVVCLATPEPFAAIGEWYRVFDQTGDDEVLQLLESAWQREGP